MEATQEIMEDFEAAIVNDNADADADFPPSTDTHTHTHTHTGETTDADDSDDDDDDDDSDEKKSSSSDEDDEKEKEKEKEKEEYDVKFNVNNDDKDVKTFLAMNPKNLAGEIGTEGKKFWDCICKITLRKAKGATKAALSTEQEKIRSHIRKCMMSGDDCCQAMRDMLLNNTPTNAAKKIALMICDKPLCKMLVDKITDGSRFGIKDLPYIGPYPEAKAVCDWVMSNLTLELNDQLFGKIFFDIFFRKLIMLLKADKMSMDAAITAINNMRTMKNNPTTIYWQLPKMITALKKHPEVLLAFFQLVQRISEATETKCMINDGQALMGAISAYSSSFSFQLMGIFMLTTAFNMDYVPKPRKRLMKDGAKEDNKKSK